MQGWQSDIFDGGEGGGGWALLEKPNIQRMKNLHLCFTLQNMIYFINRNLGKIGDLLTRPPFKAITCLDIISYKHVQIYTQLLGSLIIPLPGSTAHEMWSEN